MTMWPASAEDSLVRIANALWYIAEARKMDVPPVGLLFGDPKVDPVEFVMDLWGETRADAEEIVATATTQDDDKDWLS